MQEYPLSRNGNSAGKVTLEYQGLYCTVRCCVPDTGEILRLVDRNEAGNISIGICGPIRGGFGIEKKIPAKYLDRAQHEFVLMPQKKSIKKFYPIDAPLPAHILKQPEKCRFSVQNQRIGIVTADYPECKCYYPSG